MQKIYSFARSRSGSGFRPMRAMVAIAFFFMTNAVFAQVATYSFAQSVGPYTVIAGGTQHWFTPSGTGVVPDDNTVLNVAIGFPFTYNGTVYNNVSICNNGYLRMGATVTGTNYSGLNGPDNEIVAVHGRDLQCGWRTTATRTSGSPILTAVTNTAGISVGDNVNGTGIAVGSTVLSIGAGTVTMSANATSTGAAGTVVFGGEVRSQLIGAPGSQTFVIQYTKSRKFGSAGANERFDLQIRLNETTNVVQVVYNNCIYSTTSGTTTVGLRGLSNADFNNRTTSAPHDWNATVAGGTIAANITFSVAGATPPANGLTFTWTPVPPAACPAPFGLNATEISPTGATLNWNCTACAGPYNIEYGPTGFILGTGTMVNGVAASGYVVGGLPSSTAHQFYVTQNCTAGGNGFSLTGGPAAFTTSPANDVPCGAVALVFGNNGPYSLTGYTATAGEVAPPATGCGTQTGWCNSTLSNSAWYTFVAPASGRVILQAQDFDTQLAIYSVGSCSTYGTFTLLAANDDDAAYVAHGGALFSSYIPIDCPSLIAGQTYYVQLDPFTANTATPTDLILTDPGAIDAGFTGLPANACLTSASSTLVPNAGTGTFSGPGVTGNSWNPSVAGVGIHNITYTREAPHGCRSTTISVEVGPYGCTDPAACNWDPTAFCDDGSCLTDYGCTNPLACNYDNTATCDDGSCLTDYGCNDPSAANYDVNATCNDGSCIYGAVNENPSGAILVALGTYGQTACNSINDDLTGRYPSAFATSTLPTGEDLWYKFVATTTGARIFVDTFFDVFIEVQDIGGAQVATENAHAGNDETLNIGGLTVGNTYVIGIRAVNSNTGIGPFSLCMHALGASECDYGPGPYTLCQTFKADFVNASQYIFHLTSQTTFITYTKNNGASTFLTLSSVPMLTWGDTYDVEIDAVWNLTNSAGGAEQVIVSTNTPCSLTIVAQPLAKLRTSNNCANFGPHLLAQTVWADPFVCGAINWKWKFTRTDVPELPIIHYKGNSSRNIQLTAIPGLVMGATYDVQIAPVFSYGEGIYGAVECLSIVGPGGMVENDNQIDMDAEKIDVSTNEAAIYPNPNNGLMLNLNIAGVEGDFVAIDITDMFGKLVYSNDFAVNNSLNEVIVFDEQLASGMYNVIMFVDGKLITEKLVVTK